MAMRKHGSRGTKGLHTKKPAKVRNIFADPNRKSVERRKKMLDQFKNYSNDSLDLDELVALSAFGRQLRAEYEAQRVPEPDYVGLQLNAIRREIESKMADKREARKREIKSQLSGLKTAAERRKELEEELEKLEPATV